MARFGALVEWSFDDRKFLIRQYISVNDSRIYL